MHLGRSLTGVRLATRCTSGNSLENAADETLCRRWRDRHDSSAARQLAKRHPRSVLELKEIYRACPWDDLTGEGQVGLMRAICRFDPDQGAGFATYATWRVTVSLQSYVRKKSPRAFGRARVVDSHCRSDDVGRRRRSRVAAMSLPYLAARVTHRHISHVR
jgi:DNA-directed RNA polymerase specialized sigma subunit